MSNPPPAQTQVATTQSPKKTFQQLVDSDQFKLQIAAALPKHLTPERFIRVLMTATIKNPTLLQCTQESMFKGIFDCAACGLELDGRRAHLVPFRNKGTLEATLIVDYKGLAELAMRSGVISSIHADIVCEQDVFEVDRGEIKKHTIDYRKDRGDMYAVYCIIRMKDGGEKAEVMGKRDVDAIRRRSRAGDSGPWVTDYNEMAKKTVFKRASKWVPLSPEILNVLDAENADEPLNVTPKPSLAGLIGAPGGGDYPAAPSENPKTEATDLNEQPAPGSDPAAPTTAAPAAAGKQYTAEDRQKILKAVEDGMLQYEVGESRALKWVKEQKLHKEGQDEVSALDTAALDALLAAIPTIKKPATK